MCHSYFLPFENFTLTLGAVHLKCEDGMNVALNVFFFFPSYLQANFRWSANYIVQRLFCQLLE